MEKLFFELIQVAIGNRKSLSRVPTAREWGELYELARKQTLTGVCFVGVQKTLSTSTSSAQAKSPCLGGESHPDVTTNLPETLRLRWLGMAAKIQQKNQVVTEECVKLCKQLAHDGLYACILKGQGNLVIYPDWLKCARQPGDIDVLIRPMLEVEIATEVGHNKVDYFKYSGIRGSIEYCLLQCRLFGEKAGKICYHHMDMPWDGTTSVEAHYRATFLCSPLRNWRLQRWLEENMPWGVCDAKLGDCIFPVPPVSYNAVYQLLHIYKHLFESGIGLRQLLDYYFVLRALHVEQGELEDRTESMAQWAEGMGIGVMSNAEIMHVLSRFGLKRFAAATMFVLQKVFAMPDEYLLCKPDEREGRFLLNEILQAGNFGKYDRRIKKTNSQGGHAWEKLKHNLRLVGHYPEEVICEPFFRVYHWIWRKFSLWRY